MDNPHILPQVYTSSYVQAKKVKHGVYRLYWLGSTSEVFPGQLFGSPSEARAYLKFCIEKPKGSK